MSPIPDPSSLGRPELASLLNELTLKEQTVSTERRDLHRQIDALRTELVRKMRDEGMTVISGSDNAEPGAGGVREPRTPLAGTDSDGIALPEPPPADD